MPPGLSCATTIFPPPVEKLNVFVGKGRYGRHQPPIQKAFKSLVPPPVFTEVIFSR
jgi:hypothetical protein